MEGGRSRHRLQPTAATTGPLSTLPAEYFRGATESLNEVPQLPHLKTPTPQGLRGMFSTDQETLSPGDVYPIKCAPAL